MPNTKTKGRNLGKLIAPYQHAAPTRKFRLHAIDPGAKPLSSGERERDKAVVMALAERLDALQMLFYAAAISATGTPWAPWTVVPADSKTQRNLVIGTLLEQRLLGLKLRAPPADPAVLKLRIR
jgi:hypothetical protein